MASPVIEVRVDWRTTLGETPTFSNGGFEVDTSGWSVAAGEHTTGANSITRITSDSYAGTACAEVDVSGAAGEGVFYDFGNTVFLSGATYRVIFAIRSVADSDIANAVLGIASDRTITDVATTATWALASVEWSPSADRTGVEFAVEHQTDFRIDAVTGYIVTDVADNAHYNAVTNDGFETNTTGYSVSAGINAAGTSITRSTATPLFAGTAHGRLVTTATNGSGLNWDFGTRPFIAGREYRFKVALRSVSGTTSAKILIGSEGTSADRASSAITLTTSWVHYSVDWTPTATRLDVQAVVQNGAAAIMTADLDDVGVYETIEEIQDAANVTKITFGRGANFDGSNESPGSAVITVRNDDDRYDPKNTSSSLYGLIRPGRGVWIRATYENVLYALYAGVVRRYVLFAKGGDKFVELHCLDPLYEFARAETSVAVSLVRTVHAFRGLILDDIGMESQRRDLSTGTAEATTPYTGADQHDALNRLTDLNKATGTIHYVAPDTSSGVVWKYTTKERMELATAASSETFDGADTGVVDVAGYDLTDEAVVNSQRVKPTIRTTQASATVWTYAPLPLSLTAGETKTIWTSYDSPVSSQALVVSASPALSSSSLDAFSESGKITLTAGAATSVSDLHVTGTAITANDGFSVLAEDEDSQDPQGGYGLRRGTDIETDFIPSLAFAQALADYIVARYAEPKARPTLVLQNYFPAALEREIGDRVTLDVDAHSLAGEQFVIRSMSHEITPGLAWGTSYGLEEYALSLFFVLDTSTLDSGKLGF